MKNLNNKRLRVCRVATVPFALLSYSEHLELLQSESSDITIVSSYDENFHLLKKINVSNVVAINIAREISFVDDLISLWNLVRFFREEKFDIIHSNTPKSGLLVALAGLFTSSKVIHTFTGQRWDTISGFKRKFLIICDKIISTFNVKNYCDSPSQREYLISNGIGNSATLTCLGKGSFVGVNFKRFNAQFFLDRKEFILNELNISNETFVISYVGRLVKDKGILELIKAINYLSSKYKNIELLLVGPNENFVDEFGSELFYEVQHNSKIHLIGYTNEPEKYFAVSDVFCLPSYREGFGTVVLEAAAMGVPTIGTDIVGLKDAIMDNHTGLLIEVKNVDSLVSAILQLYLNKDLRDELGKNAHNFAISNFSYEYLTKLYIEEYRLITS